MIPSGINAQESSIPTYTCNGLEATIVGGPNATRIDGTDLDDVIVGTNDDSQERIITRGGSDVICGGLGHNVISTRGEGNTIITVPGSTNAIYTQYGRGDVCYLQPGDFQLGCETIIMIDAVMESMLTLSTDLPSYVLEQPITVNGLLEPFVVDNIPISIDISIMNPDKTIVSNTIVTIVRLDGTFGFVAEGDFTQPGTYTVEGVTNDGQRGLTTFEIVAQSIILDNALVIDSRTEEAVTTVDVGQGFKILFDMDNQLKTPQEFTTEIVFPEGSLTRDSRIIEGEIGTGQFSKTRVSHAFTPLEAGTLTININILDNLVDRNSLADPIVLQLEVVPHPPLTVTTVKTSFSPNEPIIISGQITSPINGTQSRLAINNITDDDKGPSIKFVPNPDGTFSFDLQDFTTIQLVQYSIELIHDTRRSEIIIITVELPTPTETLIVSDAQLREEFQGEITEAFTDTRVVVRQNVLNDQSITQPFVSELTVDGANRLVETKEFSLEPRESVRVEFLFIPSNAGQNTITLRLFDNLIDRNELAPASVFNLNVLSTEEEKVTDLEAEVLSLEESIRLLTLRIEALEQG